MRQFIYMAAPTPSKHTLPVGAHADVWFGTVPPSRLQLIVKPTKALRKLSTLGGPPEAQANDSSLMTI